MIRSDGVIEMVDYETGIWRDIKGYEGKYQISRTGQVKSLEREIRVRLKNGETFYKIIKERILKPALSRTRYKKYSAICLSKNGVEKSYKIHKLVRSHFKFNPNQKVCGVKPYTKAILQIDKKTGEIITEFKGSCEAERETGIDQSNISNCCAKRKHYKTAGGFVWEYKI